MTFMSPGFGNVGLARNLLAAVHRLGVKNLTGVSNNAGSLDERVDVGTLIEAGQVKKDDLRFHRAHASIANHPHSCRCTTTASWTPSWFPRAPWRSGCARRRRRASALSTLPPAWGTELAEGKEHREINGRTYVLEYPLPADFALIRAYRADTFGNLQFRLTQRNFNPIMAMAADVTVVEVEDSIVEPGEIDPDCVHVPGVYVDRLVKIPEKLASGTDEPLSRRGRIIIRPYSRADKLNWQIKGAQR